MEWASTSKDSNLNTKHTLFSEHAVDVLLQKHIQLNIYIEGKGSCRNSYAKLSYVMH